MVLSRVDQWLVLLPYSKRIIGSIPVHTDIHTSGLFRVNLHLILNLPVLGLWEDAPHPPNPPSGN